MRIILLHDIPVAKENGLVKGREMEIHHLEEWDGSRGSREYWVMGDTGEEVRLMPYEFEDITTKADSQN